MKHLYTALLLLFGLQGIAQMSTYCGFDAYHASRKKTSAQYNSDIAKIDKRIAESLDLNNALFKNRKNRSAGVYTIPVVFHIIHNGGPENIHDSLVYNALDLLNQSFSNVGYYDSTVGANTNIQFCLAQQDPDGNPHTGIDRVMNPDWVPFDVGGDLTDMLTATYWNTHFYYNIWVTSVFSGGGPQGFATLPVNHGDIFDGIVVQFLNVGTNPVGNTLLTHETGHYLGLYHTFYDGCVNNNCLIEGDRVCDTPPDDLELGVDSCSQLLNTCSTDTIDVSINNPFRPVSMGGLGDQYDHIQNHMDYSPWQCYHDFTQGQADRMRNVLENERRSLLTTTGCMAPCVSGTIDSLVFSQDEFEAGIPISIAGVYDTTRTHFWMIDFVTVSTAGGFNYTFTDTGYHYITLCINDSCGTCFTDSVYVTCSAISNFSVSASSALPGSTITLDATGSVYDVLVWVINGDTLSTGLSTVNYTFNEIGNYTIQLIAYNGTCHLTSQQQISIKQCAAINRTANWIFGNHSGMSFDSEGTHLLSSPINPYWSSATISDELGGLLFFTDGYRYYTKNHAEMPSSPVLYAAGGIQTAVILKRPGTNQLYDVPVLLNGGDLTFARVDMAQNGGLGDIVDDNDSVYVGSNSCFHSVDHCNGKDKWIVTHKKLTNQYWSFLQTESGINPAVISTSGSVNSSTGVYSNIKISPDGTKIIMTFSGESFFEISDFNTSTGVVSGSIKINLPSSTGIVAEFSGNGNVLYVTKQAGGIVQYNVTTMDSTTIQSSAYEAAAGAYTWGPGSIQIGPDHKIYIAKGGSYLDVIAEPNVLGVGCNFTTSTVPVTVDAGSLLGFHASYFNPIDLSQFTIAHASDTICVGQAVPIHLSSPFCADSIVWHVSGPCTHTITSDTSITVIGSALGAIQLIATREGVCSEWADTLNLTVTNCTNVTEITQNNAVRVYPNPAHDYITLEFTNPLEENINITVFNALGQGVITTKLLHGEKTLRLATGTLQKGVYQISVRTAQTHERKSIRFIVE